MAVVSCPKCSTGLRVPDGSVAAVRCPKCTTVFQPRAKPAADFEVVDDSPPAPRPAPQPAAPQKKAFSLDDAVRSADKPARRDDRDDDRRRDDRDDDRPRGRSRRDDDDYDDDYDRPRKASKYGVAKPGVLLIGIAMSLYLGGLALHALLGLIAWMGADIPYGLYALAGVVGLSGWVVGLVGFGLAIAGPARARGLAIAVVSVSFVHLVLAFVVAYNERGSRFGGQSTLRWEALVTELDQLDTLLALLVYNAKSFSNHLLSLFAGATELARLILVGLLLGSLARSTKAHGAESLSKFGWIAAPAAVGVATLVVLLAAVMAESTVKSAMRPEFTPPPQFGGGGNFQEQMRQQEQWRAQQQAEVQRIQERGQSLQRTLRFWTNGSQLLVYTLHIGTLVLPLMASFGVWRSMSRRR